MLAILSVFLITLGLGQLISTHWKLRGASLIGSSHLAGYGLGVLLLVGGVLTMPGSWSVLWWTLLAGPLAVILLLWGGSYISPPPHPHRLFEPNHPAHSGCYPVQIPDGGDLIPGLLLFPPRLPARGENSSSLVSFSEKEDSGPAVCLIPGSGCNKTFFNWRLVRAMLAEGLIVLTIDPPGHGDYRHRLLTYPDCLSTIPAAIRFLREQPGVTKVGLVGISLGGALAIRSLSRSQFAPAGLSNPAESGGFGNPPRAFCDLLSLVENPLAKSEIDSRVDALVLLEVPVRVKYSRALFYRELWRTLYGSPALSLLKEMSAKQVWQEWHSGGYRGQYSTAELIALLNPLENIRRVKAAPLLLVYSRRDPIAPPEAARAMQQAAPQATFIESKKASHVMLTLIPEINRQVALWLRKRL